MRTPWQWATASNQRAISNARAATIDCSRRRVERAEVAQYLASVPAPLAGPTHGAQHPA
jgi:hypothetical protein